MKPFFYLVGCGARNRVLTSVRRLRRPRYAIALILGGAYLWFFLLRPATGSPLGPVFVGPTTESIVTLLYVVTLLGPWVFGGEQSALAFSQAEVAMLFPAPLSRRQLIRYKLFRAQLVVLINALIFVFVLRRGGGPLPSLLRAIALWVLFSTASLHRLGAALVRTSWREHGMTGVRRNAWSTAVSLIVIVLLTFTLIGNSTDLFKNTGIGHFLTALSNTIQRPPASWVLYPFHLVIAPTFAQTANEWLREIGPAMIVLALHALWVLTTDTNFEEAAVEASARRAAVIEAARSAQGWKLSPPRVRESPVRLAAAGPPMFAILWKNILCLRRTAQLRVFLGPVMIAVMFGVVFAEGHTGTAPLIARTAILLVALLFLLGTAAIRNDLRQDMQNLVLLKTLPLPPSELMVAEVASSALPMWIVQLVLVIIAYVASLFWSTVPLTHAMRLSLLFASPFVLLALNAAHLTVRNGMAVLFPAWVRLGPQATGGVEALGQNLLTTLANMFSLAIGLIVPALAGFGVMMLLGRSGPIAVYFGILAGSILLAGETYLVLRGLGRAFAKAEPAASV